MYTRVEDKMFDGAMVVFEGGLDDNRSALLFGILDDEKDFGLLLRLLDELAALLPPCLHGPDEDNSEDKNHADKSPDTTSQDERDCATLPFAEVHEGLRKTGEERGVLEAVDTLALPESGTERICLCGLEPRLGHRDDVNNGNVRDLGAMKFDSVRTLDVVREVGVMAMNVLHFGGLQTHVFPEHVGNVGCLGAHAAALVLCVADGRAMVGRGGWENDVGRCMPKTKMSKHVPIANLPNLCRWSLSAYSTRRERYRA